MPWQSNQKGLVAPGRCGNEFCGQFFDFKPSDISLRGLRGLSNGDATVVFDDKECKDEGGNQTSGESPVTSTRHFTSGKAF
jgi:hypothetical protein